MNNATFAGRLGRDAEVRTAGDNLVAGFSIAVDKRGRGGAKETLWVDCSLWGDRAEKLAPFLTRAKQVVVSGEVDVRTYQAQGETRAVVTLNVRELTLMGGGEAAQGGGDRQAAAPAAGARGASSGRAAGSSAPSRPAPAPASADEDEIPF